MSCDFIPDENILIPLVCVNHQEVNRFSRTYRTTELPEEHFGTPSREFVFPVRYPGNVWIRNLVVHNTKPTAALDLAGFCRLSGRG